VIVQVVEPRVFRGQKRQKTMEDKRRITSRENVDRVFALGDIIDLLNMNLGAAHRGNPLGELLEGAKGDKCRKTFRTSY
jgi:hypothetical protein